MSKRKSDIDRSIYSYLLDAIQVYPEDEVTDDELMDDFAVAVEEEIEGVEPIYTTSDGEIRLTRLGVLNSIVDAFIPGYRIVLEIDEDNEVIEKIYLDRVQ